MKEINVEHLNELFKNIILTEEIGPHKSTDPKTEIPNVTFNSTREDQCSTPEDYVGDCNSVKLLVLHPSNKDSIEYKKEKEYDGKTEEDVIAPKPLFKRGPQRKNRPLHIQTPYSGQGKYCLQCQSTVNTRTTVGKVISSDEDTNFPNENGTCLPHMQGPPVLVSTNLIESSHKGNASIVPDLSDQFLEDEFLTNTLDLFFKPDEPFPDLGICNLFLDSQDPRNSTPEAPVSEFEQQMKEDCYSFSNTTQAPEPVQEVVEEAFSVQSAEVGYISDSTDCMSNVDSPVSLIHRISSDLTVTSRRKRTSSNPYFTDLDRDYCDNCCKDILKKANEKDGLYQKDKFNRTLLHLKVQQRNEVYCIVLLSMLQKSFQNGTGIKTLPTFPDLPTFINQRDAFGHTPLLLACMYNLPKVFDYLLDCGASPTLNEKFCFGSVLHYVCEQGSQFQQFAEILSIKAASCVNMQNSRKETPLHIAVRYHGFKYENEGLETFGKVDNFSLVRLLLDKNAKLKAQDELGRTPLHWMIITKNLDLLNLLCSKAYDWKAAVNLQDLDGRTVLHGAAQYSNIAVEKQKNLVHKLLSCFASPLIADNQGRYPKDMIPDDRRKDLSVLNDYFCSENCVDVSFF